RGEANFTCRAVAGSMAKTSDIKSASGQIDLLAPAPFGLSAQPIDVARIPAAPFALANIAASAALNSYFIIFPVPAIFRAFVQKPEDQAREIDERSGYELRESLLSFRISCWRMV